MKRSQEIESSPAIRRSEVLLFVAALALFFVPAITSMTQKTATFDEPVYIIAGLSYWVTGEHIMKEDAPPLVARLAGLSPLVYGHEIPGGKLPFRDSLGREYPYSISRLYDGHHRADEIIFLSRLLILVPFGLILLSSVYFWSRELFGRSGGAISLLFAALSPNLIAHGRLVAADFPSAAMMVFTSYAFWRLLKDPKSRSRMILFGTGLGLALITKYTMVLLVPSLGLVGVVAVLKGKASSRAPFLRSSAIALVIAAAFPFVVYGFPPQPGTYIEGLNTIYRNISNQAYPWYLLGEFHRGGVWYYYLVVIAIKTSAPLLILGLVSWFWVRTQKADLLAELCLVVPAIALLVAAANDEISAGIRRVIAILPVLCIAAGRLSQVRFEKVPSWVPRGVIATGLAWHAASSFLTWPHYIPYFNELSGGRENGHRLLDDSAVDWGQDLVFLRDLMIEKEIPLVRLCYFGSAPPSYYDIRHEETPPALLLRPRSGVYAISLHHLIRMQLHGFDWLNTKEPFAKAGTSIWLYEHW